MGQYTSFMDFCPTVFAEQMTPHKVWDRCTQPSIGMYFIYVRSKHRSWDSLKLWAILKLKCSILKSTVYAVAVKDVAELQGGSNMTGTICV
jgi:hypothetical protein